MPVKKTFNPATFAVTEAKTSADIVADEAIMARLNTSTLLSGAKSTLDVRIMAALAIITANCVVAISPSEGVVCISGNGAHITAMSSLVSGGKSILMAQTDSLSTNGERCAAYLADDVLNDEGIMETDNFVPVVIPEGNLKDFADIFLPKRPAQTLGTAIAAAVSYALTKGANSVVLYNQADGSFMYKTGGGLAAAIPGTPGTGTITMAYVEDADVVVTPPTGATVWGN